MSCGPQFHETVMGRRFYESTVPELVRQLTRLNDLIEQQNQPEGGDRQTGEDTASGQ